MLLDDRLAFLYNHYGAAFRGKCGNESVGQGVLRDFQHRVWALASECFHHIVVRDARRYYADAFVGAVDEAVERGFCGYFGQISVGFDQLGIASLGIYGHEHPLFLFLGVVDFAFRSGFGVYFHDCP